MSRDLSTGLSAEIAKDRLSPILLAEIDTVDGNVYVWSGAGNLIWNGLTFVGTGNLGSVTPAEETSELQAAGMTFTMSGIPSDLIATALRSMRQGLPAKLWLATLDSQLRMTGSPALVFSGLTDVPTIEEGAETSAISFSAESRLVDLERPRTRFYTTEDQKLVDPTDKGFDYVPLLQDDQIIWGR